MNNLRKTYFQFLIVAIRWALIAVLFGWSPFQILNINFLIVSPASAEESESCPDQVDEIQSSSDTEEQTEPPEESPLDREENKETIVDVLHAEVSRGIQGTGAWMDSFFGDRRYETERNESYVRFRYNIFLEENAGMVREPDLQVRIILPQLREKTHLVLSGAEREEREFSAIGSGENDQVSTINQRKVRSAAIQQTVRETADDSLILRAGLQLRRQRLAIMLGPRYRILFPLDKWKLRFVEEVLWRSKTGWESRTTTDLERPLPNGLFFRATNDWIWTEDVKGFLYALSFQLGQPINHTRGLEYEWANIFHTKPIHELTEIALRIRYRQQMWRKWLYFEVSPQYRFPRDRDFKAIPGILFRIDMIMGSY